MGSCCFDRKVSIISLTKFFNVKIYSPRCKEVHYHQFGFSRSKCRLKIGVSFDTTNHIYVRIDKNFRPVTKLNFLCRAKLCQIDKQPKAGQVNFGLI